MNKPAPGNLVQINCRWAILLRGENCFHSFEKNPYAIFIKRLPRVRAGEREINEAHSIVLHEDKLVPIYNCYVKSIRLIIGT